MTDGYWEISDDVWLELHNKGMVVLRDNYDLPTYFNANEAERLVKALNEFLEYHRS